MFGQQVNNLERREMFAVSLRKKLKAEILAEKRKKLQVLLQTGTPRRIQTAGPLANSQLE
jgi:hypothetical protein